MTSFFWSLENILFLVCLRARSQRRIPLHYFQSVACEVYSPDPRTYHPRTVLWLCGTCYTDMVPLRAGFKRSNHLLIMSQSYGKLLCLSGSLSTTVRSSGSSFLSFSLFFMRSCSANAFHVHDGESLSVFLTCVSVWEHQGGEERSRDLVVGKPGFHFHEPKRLSCEGSMRQCTLRVKHIVDFQ